MSESRNQVLFVDDDVKAGDLFLRFSKDEGFETHVFTDAHSALEHFESHGADAVITDLSMPGKDGMSLMEDILNINLDTVVIMITGYSTVDNAIQAMKLGAYDFIKKPYDTDELIALIHRSLDTLRLKQENRLLKRQLSQEKRSSGMIGKSPALKNIQAIIDKIADVRCNVIVEGETGTGKELVARAIHDQSQDADKPFIVIDCGAVTESLLESELFGHEKGAFTGAAHTRRGLLEEASGGTVFLDEVCNISEAMQIKLLRVVQENQLLRVGGVKPIDVDLRFITATNQNLEQMIKAGRFREDLYHRLHVIKITLPTLRERVEDIPLLAQHFIDEFARRYQRDVKAFEATAMKKLCSYNWPGNIRELRNLVERSVALADGQQIHLDQIAGECGSTDQEYIADIQDWPSLKDLEYRYIDRVVKHTDGNREQAAGILGINKSTLWRKLKQ